MKYVIVICFVFISFFSRGQENKFSQNIDSVSLEKIIYKGEVLHKKNLQQDISLGVTNDDIIVDGLKVGDHENKLRSKFPLSTAHKSIWSSRYEDHKNPHKYYYVVEVGESKTEHLIFNIENKKIVSIEINIYAPPN